MTAFSEERGQLIWRSDGETMIITPWGENGLRVRARMMGDIEDTDWALLPSPPPEPPRIHIDGARASIHNGGLTATVEDGGWRQRGRISFTNARGEPLLREIGDGGALDLHARHFRPILGGDHSLSVAFDGNDGERLYGMGQYQQDLLDIKHCTLELAHRNSQASIPFVLSSRGYGFLWHNPAIGEVTFGRNRTTWTAQSTRQMDYWITAGDTPAQIIQAYAAVTGTVPMMPEHGLGFWQCKLRYWNQEQLLGVAREYHRRGIPVDVIVCDFFHWPKMGDFRFEGEFFPDPGAMVRELASMGMRLMVSVWPQISLESENYREMRRQGLLVRAEYGEQVGMRFGGDSMFFDATNPRARAYVWEKCRQNYYDHGIEVFWLDEAEPEYGTYDFINYRYHMGPNVQVGNLYPQLYARTFYDGMRAAGQEGIVNLLRCAWAGSQRYGALVWSGGIHSDWKTFRRQLCAGLNMGIAGIPWWTTDIGGFSGGDPSDPAFRELLVRWFQWGAFCPVMRLHGDRQPTEHPTHADGTPALFSGADNEIWSYGEEAYPILVRYIRLREAMRGYTRALMREAHETGAPVMRAMFYEFPDDAACWDLQEQYMYGPDVLVAPVMRPAATSVRVYLPAGHRWTLLSTGAAYDGGMYIDVPVTLEDMPIFLRDAKHMDWRGAL